MRLFLSFVCLLFCLSSSGQNTSDRKEIAVIFSTQNANLNRAQLASEFFNKRDLGDVHELLRTDDSKQKLFGIDYLLSASVGDNYRTEILIGPFVRASVLNATLTYNATHLELARTLEQDPVPTLTVVESIERQWTSYQNEQLEGGAVLQALYRFNRRLNLRYGFRAGLRYSIKNQFIQVRNEQVKRSVTIDGNTSSNSNWELDSKLFSENDNFSWATGASIGIDYKIFDNKPFYLGLAWSGSIQQVRGVEDSHIVPLSGFEIRLSSSF